MLSQREIEQVIELAKKYDIGRVYLVGSAALLDAVHARDYDFAISDFPPGNFFKFYADLQLEMPKEVDLIDVSGSTNLFKEIVVKEGKLLYEKRAASRPLPS